MDTIWNSAFGIDIDCQNENDNIYLTKGIRHFRDLADLSYHFLINR